MSVKTAGVGHFTIPTAPAAGVSCTSGAANVLTTTYVQLIASTAAAIYITGIHIEAAAASAATYKLTQLATGGAGSETVVGQYLTPMSTGSTVALGYRQIYPPIPVATATRIACKTADSVGSQATLITLECINQANVVTDGIVVAANVTQWNSTAVATPATAGIPDVNIKNMNNVAATAITTVKAVQGLTTADTITTTTNLTNLPSIPANWITAAGITAAALNGKGDWNVGKTGYSLTQTFPTNFASLGISAAGKVNGVVLTDTLTTYTGNTPQTADVGATATAIKTQTDKLTFSIANQVDANVKGP